MLSCLPEFLPDELVYSVIAALKDRLPLQDYSMFQLAFGRGHYDAMYHLPNNLSFFLSQLPPYYDMTLDRLINEHTLYPYYAASLPADRRQHLWNLMCEDSRQGLLAAAGIVSTIICSPQSLRYCPICTDEDQKKYGRSYWHRLHQLPGVFICPIHQVLIEDSNILLRTRYKYYLNDFISPKRAHVSKLYTKSDSLKNNHLQLTQLAKNSMQLLNTPNICLEPSQTKQIYKYILYERGFSSLKAKTNVNTLASNIIEFYSQNILEELGCMLSEAEKNRWLLKAMSAHHKIIHPLFHLLLITFFGFSVEDFLQLPTEIKLFGNGPWSCCNIFCKYYDKPVISQYSLQHSHHKFTGTFTCICGYSYMLITSRDEPSFRKPKKAVKTYGPVWEAAFIEVWNEETLSLNKRSKKVGMNDARSFLNYGQKLGLALPPPGSNSIWTPIARSKRLQTSSNSINWQSRDLEICLEVDKIVTELRSIDKKPKRITRDLIARHLPPPYFSSVRTRFDMLPETAKLIARTVDTDETFALRAIEWAKLECNKTKARKSLHAFLVLASIHRLNLSTYVLDVAKKTLKHIQKTS